MKSLPEPQETSKPALYSRDQDAIGAVPQDHAMALIEKTLGDLIEIESSDGDSTEKLEELKRVLFDYYLKAHDETSDNPGPPGYLIEDAPTNLSTGVRLPLPWEAINKQLGGGIAVGQPLTIMGTTGGGKSLILSAIAAKLLQDGKNVLRIDWENEGELNLAEIVANLHQPEDGSRIEDPRSQYRTWQKANPDAGQYINIHPQDYPDIEVDEIQIKAWVAEWERILQDEENGGKKDARIDAILIDYFDYLESSRLFDKYRNEWKVQDKLFMALWAYAKKSKRGLYILLQSNRAGNATAKKEGKLDGSSIAGSFGKFMKAPYAITAVPHHDLRTTTLSWQKARGADTLLRVRLDLTYKSFTSPAGSRGYLTDPVVQEGKKSALTVTNWMVSKQRKSMILAWKAKDVGYFEKLGATEHKNKLIIGKKKFLKHLHKTDGALHEVATDDLAEKGIIEPGSRPLKTTQLRIGENRIDCFVIGLKLPPEGGAE